VGFKEGISVWQSAESASTDELTSRILLTQRILEEDLLTRLFSTLSFYVAEANKQING
jgi:hypothetical protein